MVTNMVMMILILNRTVFDITRTFNKTIILIVECFHCLFLAIIIDMIQYKVIRMVKGLLILHLPGL